MVGGTTELNQATGMVKTAGSISIELIFEDSHRQYLRHFSKTPDFVWVERTQNQGF